MKRLITLILLLTMLNISNAALPSSPLNGSYPIADVDQDGSITPLTDGLITLRYLFGFSGQSLINNNVVSASCVRCSATEITTYLQAVTDAKVMDCENNGTVSPLADGLLFLRYLFGFTGSTLVSGVVSSDAQNTSATVLEECLGTLTALDIIPAVISAIDSDGDGTADIYDADDDNDNVLDNDDYRPLDSSITVTPTYNGTINSYEQTYVRKDKPNTNYSNKNFIQIRGINNASFATAGLLYFTVPSTLNGKRTDNISAATLTVKSDTEKDTIRLFASTDNNFPNAATATWNNTSSLFGQTPYGSAAINPGSVATIPLTSSIHTGSLVFIVDETGDDSREKLIKNNNEIYLNLSYQEADPIVVNVTQITGSKATISGGELRYQISLANAPTHEVLVPLQLLDSSTASITSNANLIFTPTNYNVAQSVTITGENDGSNTGSKDNKLLIYPLTSVDTSYNGVNPADIDFKVYDTLPDANSGEAYSYTVGLTANDISYDLINAPYGMSINSKTGVITWQADSSEVGSYDLTIQKTQSSTVTNRLVNLTVKQLNSNPGNAFYVVPGGNISSPSGSLGSIGNPFTSIEAALSAASNSSNSRTIYIRGGRYDNIKVNITAVIKGSKNNQIIVTKLPGERVKLNFSGTSAFYIAKDASYIVFDGFEIDGHAINDHWSMLANNWWDPNGDSSIGGGQAFNVDGQHITIRNNVIHDTYQKGINIFKGRYINVVKNIVYNIGHSSLSGGHGIMRKWPRNFHNNPTDGADLGVDVYDSPEYQYRFDITGNLLFTIEQRIYSRVFSRGYSNLTIDEGKAILLDQTDDTDPKARVSNNLILYCGTTGIRLKKNPNMQVHNNSLLMDLSRTDTQPDGITDKNLLPNLKFYGNLVASKGVAIDVDASFTDASGTDTDPNKTRKYDNYVAGGGTISKAPLAGIINLGGTDSRPLFTDPTHNNFHPVVSGNSVPVGVGDSYLQDIFDLVGDYDIDVKPSGWQHDHLRNADTIIANIPKTLFDTKTYYIGNSSIEPGHQALFIKFIDTDKKWLYTKREVEGVRWTDISNPTLTDPQIFDLPNVDIQKSNAAKGAYVFQLIAPQIWFDIHGNNSNTTFTITNADGSTTSVVYLDPENNIDHKHILEYSAEGKVRSY